MQKRLRITMMLAACLPCAWLAGCASTSVALTPAPQAPVCEPSATALVLWSPQWRPDQKDIPAREAAAASGLERFFARSGCFAHSTLRRVDDLGSATSPALALANGSQYGQVVTITVHELGPVIRLLSSAALLEGGTEVTLQISTYTPGQATQPRTFAVHWQHGGPGVIKGVANLPDDMEAALRAGFQSGQATH